MAEEKKPITSSDAAVLAIATASLKTKKGKNLISSKLDPASLLKEITSLTQEYNFTPAELEDLKKTAFPKVDKELSAKEKIALKKEGRKQAVSDVKNLALQKLKDLKKQLKSQTPTVFLYKLNGKVFDRTTGNPLEGVELSLGISPTPFGEIPNANSVLPVPQELITTAVSVNPQDFTYVPYSDLITSGNKKTNSKGEYEIVVSIPVIPENQKCPIDVALLFKKEGFIQSSIFLLNGDRTVKTDLPASSIINTKIAAENASKQVIDTIDAAQQGLQAIALGAVDLGIVATKSSLSKLTNKLKASLIPQVLQLLILFGISKVSDANRKVCPTPNTLAEISKKRNQLVRQLNQIYRTIITNTALAAAFSQLSGAIKGIRLQLDALPIPQAIGVPPAKDFGGLIFAQPYSFTAKIQAIDDLLAEIEKTQKQLSRAILVQLVILIATAVAIILLLRSIDKMSQECAEANGSTIEEQEAIDAGLLELSQEQELDGNPVISNINGFILSVETDNSNPVGTLKRRFAVAKDSRGITLLKGESSFSSNDQILIDELVFYIQQNDLKAF